MVRLRDLVRSFDVDARERRSLLNVVVLAICLPLAQRFRAARMPLIDAALVRHPAARRDGRDAGRDRRDASRIGRPDASAACIALFPVVFDSLMLILQPRIGGPATAAVLANGHGA